jgi:hypothetical protein
MHSNENHIIQQIQNQNNEIFPFPQIENQQNNQNINKKSFAFLNKNKKSIMQNESKILFSSINFYFIHLLFILFFF